MKVTRCQFEEVQIEYPSDDHREKVFEWLRENGFGTISRSGPKMIGLGRADPSVQHLIAHKYTSEPTTEVLP